MQSGCARPGAICRSSRGGHIISNKAEHHAVLNAVEHLENHEGFEVTWLNVSRDGMVDLDQLADSIRPDTRLVSIMTANNETGVIQPMREISRICRERGVLLHSDMVQSFGKIGCRCLAGRCRQFCCAQILRTKGRGISFLAKRLVDPADHVRRRARKSAATRDRKCRWQ